MHSDECCTAVASAAVERWNGTKWTVQQTVPHKSSCPFNPNGCSEALSDVSCWSATGCVAVGQKGIDPEDYTSGQPFVESWNGRRWAEQPTDNYLNAGEDTLLESVSCSFATACAAVGTNVDDIVVAGTWDGHRWSPHFTYSQPPPLNGVSCFSARACTAIGYGAAARWNGRKWSLQQIGGNGRVLTGVSCPSATTCTAVGDQPLHRTTIVALAETWSSSRSRSIDP
ncbi:MAG: hypothetical protein ACXVH3_31235 [Solirubrobacteraceae bacterium]